MLKKRLNLDRDIKKKNIDFWTRNVPGIDNRVKRDTIGTEDFYKKVDSSRYEQEPYLYDLFNRILEPAMVSLEVGIGLGSDLRSFSRKGLKVIGLDYSPENAYLSNIGLKVFKLEGVVVSGDAEYLPFPDNSFDLVYSLGCLHHTPNTQKGIDELFRTVRLGGKAVVMLYHKGYQFWYMAAGYILGFKWINVNFQDYLSAKYDQTPLSRIYSKRQLRKMFNKFKDIDIEIVTFGGIQYHPILKYVWKIFNKWPWLMRKFGSFAIITAKKTGNQNPVGNYPLFCCPKCYSALDFKQDSIKCINVACATEFVKYKNEIFMLHPNAQELYQRWPTAAAVPGT